MSSEFCKRCNKYLNLTDLHLMDLGNERIYYCDECYKEIEKEIKTEYFIGIPLEYKKVKIVYQDLDEQFKEIDFECLDWKGFENKKIKNI